MFGSIGAPEIVLIFIVALLIFGPRKLPELGRALGRTITDFRRATQDIKNTLEKEIEEDSSEENRRYRASSTTSTDSRPAGGEEGGKNPS